MHHNSCTSWEGWLFSSPHTSSSKNLFSEYLFSHFNQSYPSPCTTTGCIPKNNYFSEQLVPTYGLVELRYAFYTLEASDPLLRWNVQLTDLWLKCCSGAPVPMTWWPCFHRDLTTHYSKKLSFLCPTYVWTPKRITPTTCVNIHWRAASTTYTRHCITTLILNLVMADQPWNSQTANSHGKFTTLSTAQSHVVPPVTPYTCVKYVEPFTVPSSIPTGTGPFSKPTPWTPLQLFIPSPVPYTRG